MLHLLSPEHLTALLEQHAMANHHNDQMLAGNVHGP